MKVSHLSLRQLSLLVSITIVLLFVSGYLSIKYIWSYDQAVKQAKHLQFLEVERVKMAINIEKSDMASTIEDYAAWDDLADFVAGKQPSFIERSMNEYVLESKVLDGIFVFDYDVKLVWGMRYDHHQRQPISFGSIKYQFGQLLADSLRSDTNVIQPMVKLLVIDDEPFLLATTRICNSDGQVCTKGFLMFIKKVRSNFISQIEGSTGLKIDISVAPMNEAPQSISMDGYSYIVRKDYQNRFAVIIKVIHSVQLPSFIEWKEFSALAAFSLLMLAFNLFAASLFVSPFKRAQVDLKTFRKTGSIPKEQPFLSYEMNDFSRNMHQLINELEANRKELAWQSAHDPLTGVANRRELERVIDQQITEQRCRHLLLFIIDVDHFKLYNDNYSHIGGDNVLKQVADQLAQLEFVGDKIVARIGGEEFCICLFSAEPIDADKQAKRLLATVEQLAIPHHFSPTKPIVSVSIGAILSQNPSFDEFKTLFQDADQALYQSKRLGRDRYTLHRGKRDVREGR